MRAVTIADGELRIDEHPDPVPGTGELLVRVRAAGLNGADMLQRRGLYPAPPGSPQDIPGLELAGEVTARGPGATRFEEGDRVMAIVGGGGQAELAVVHERVAMPVPDQLDWPAAGGFPEVFITAHDALFTQAGLAPGEHLLVHGAAGGVGTAAVQIAASVGARVLAVASARNHDYLRALGARDVFDYHAADWVDQVRAAVPGGVDVLFDGAGGDTRDRAVGAVRDGGRAVFIVGPPSALERNISADAFAADVNRERLEALNRLVEEGKLRVAVEAVFPLDQAREALERVAGGHTRGKIVLTVG